MCLRVDCDDGNYAGLRQVAEEDISVFKVLRVRHYYVNDAYEAPYFDTEYVFNTVYMSELQFRYRYAPDGESVTGIRVEEGLHSMATKEGAQNIIDDLKKYETLHKFIICEAKIPAGSLYYLGDFERKGASYASNQLVVLKEIE